MLLGPTTKYFQAPAIGGSKNVRARCKDFEGGPSTEIGTQATWNINNKFETTFIDWYAYCISYCFKLLLHTVLITYISKCC